MSSRKARIGFIGVGTMGSIHLQQFAMLDSVKIVAVADPNLVRRERAAHMYQVERSFSDGAQLIEHGELDAVVIATSNRTHASLSIAALQGGLHVLVEKPMGYDPLDAKLIVDAQRATNKSLLVGHHLRWLWPVSRLKQQIEKGDFGTIYYVKAGELRRKGIPAWGSPYTQQAHMGGGAAVDIAIHVLDLAMYLLGDPRPVAVSGVTYKALGHRRIGIGDWGERNDNGLFDVEDLAAGIVRLEGGVAINLEASWAAHTDAEDNRQYLHLMGSNGGFSLRGSGAKWMLEAFGEPADVKPEAPRQAQDPRLGIALHFVDCISGRALPHVTAHSGYVNNVILDALYRSAAQQSEITDLGIDYIP